MTGGARQPVARAAVCALLREGAPPVASVPADVLAAARADEVHLLLADRLRLPSFGDELRDAAVVEACRAHELQRVLAGMAAAGVRPILLKGASLAWTHYSRPELRPRSDTDLMIPSSDRDASARALIDLGYTRLLEVDGDVAIGQFHFQRHDRNGLFHAVDVHWRVSNVRVFADVLTYEELARDAVALPALGAGAWGPSAVHALLIACVHRVAHHADTDNLLWLFDVHLLARRFTPHERDAFTALASTRRMRAVSARTLSLAQEAFGGLDVEWIAALSDPDAWSEPSAAFLGGGLRQVDILRADFAATPGWKTRLELLREHLFPRATFIYERYGVRTRFALPWLYLHRIVTGLPKWFRR
jgi:putative nucleotidyltransferase-like protein